MYYVNLVIDLRRWHPSLAGLRGGATHHHAGLPRPAPSITASSTRVARILPVTVGKSGLVVELGKVDAERGGVVF